ncbi:MAG: sigma-70 family RNA polymerase sigma factor [Candidatus Paceibacterota bacterium]|jgi:RNA polymerase sigma-70 factor (ECF subfamily)
MEKITEYNTKLLMNLAKNGDSEAFEAVYCRYFTPIYRYILCGVRNREIAEDIAQTVFLKAFKMIENYKDNGSDPAPYFYTIAKNAVIDHWKKKKDILYGDDPERVNTISDVSKNPLEKIEDNEKAQELMECVGKLSEDQKEIITLKFICDLSNREISAYTGKNEDAIRQLQCRALRSLKNILKTTHENK